MLEKRVGIIMYQTSNSKGQELVAQRMVRDFNKLGQKAYLITSTYHDGAEVAPRGGLLRRKGYYCVEDSALGIPVIRVESNLAKWPPRRIIFRDFVTVLNQIVDDYGLNVLITHSTLWNGPEDTAKFVAWRRDMQKMGGYRDPIVFCHMSHFQEPSSQRYSIPELTFRTAWNKISLSKILEAANLILVVTPMEKKAKVRMGAKPERCFLYPGGVDSETFFRFAAEDVGDFLKRHNLSPETRIVSYLGTLEERKNPLGVLKVAELLKERQDIHFILAGKGESPYADEIIKTANNLPNVSYLGEIDEREKVLLIRASYLNILLSRLEALGITQLEFMYCGVPVVTSGAGGQAWVVDDGIDGMHVNGAGDVTGAAEAVVRLVDDKQIHRQMSADARERAGKFASISITAELDSAINNALIKESGLTGIPLSMRDTLSRPENVLKSWSSGTTGVVATNERLFIKKGLISRRLLEVRYPDIRAMEHIRRYPWKVPLSGAILTGLAFFAPWLKGLLSENLVNLIREQVNGILGVLHQQLPFDDRVLTLLPLAVSLLIFLIDSRTGFLLHIAGTKPVYLPGDYKKAVEFIRQVQDREISKGEKPAPEQDSLESVWEREFGGDSTKN